MPLGSRRAGRASRFDVFNGTTEIPPRTLLLLLLRDADQRELNTELRPRATWLSLLLVTRATAQGPSDLPGHRSSARVTAITAHSSQPGLTHPGVASDSDQRIRVREFKNNGRPASGSVLVYQTLWHHRRRSTPVKRLAGRV